MGELDVNKNELVKLMEEIELHPALVETEVGVANYTKLPMSRVLALGTSFEPLAVAFNNVVNGSASGLYRVTVPNGMHLAEFKSGIGNLGSALNSNNQVAGQAVLNPLVFNPTTLFMAATMANIDKKLDVIQEIQQEMLDFVVQKEKSELTGDLKFLADVLNNYKYNWNNEKYKNGNHIKVLDIKQSAERKIDFYRELIIKKTNKKSLFHSDQDVMKQLNKIQDDFGDYQLALYIHSFSAFLEVMLLENFNSDYLNGIMNKIESYSLKYRELYTACYSQIENNSKTSIQAHLLKGLVSANKVTGELIAKVPIISKSQIDESLKDASSKLNKYGDARTTKTMQNILNRQNSFVRPFIESIDTINRLYNKPMEILFDHENIYIGTIAE